MKSLRKMTNRNARPIVDWMATAPPKESFDFLEAWKVELSPKEVRALLRFPTNEISRFAQRLLDRTRSPKRTRDLVPWIHLMIKHNPNYNIAKSPVFWNLLARPGVLEKIADDVFEWGVAMCKYGDYRSGTIFLHRVWATHGSRIDTPTLKQWLTSAIAEHDHGSGFLFQSLLERFRTPIRHLLRGYSLQQVVEFLEKAASGSFDSDFFLVGFFLEIAREEISSSSYDHLVHVYKAEVRKHAEARIEGSTAIVDEVARLPKKKHSVDPL